MSLVLAGMAVLVVSAIAALCASKSARWATLWGVLGALCACALELLAAARVLLGGRIESLKAGWLLPFASFYVEVDPLSAFFLLTTFSVGAATALYGSQYLQSYRHSKSLGPPWFFFNLALASICMLIVARNAVLFLIAWEMMTLAAYFLVVFEDEKPEARSAGWTYLVATHLGTMFVVILFISLGLQSGSLDFDRFAPGDNAPGLLFILALIGFGTKAGVMPMHIWLPDAHPAAPSHVSALMSGVIIKTGIYGLVRTLTFLGPPAAWWGWVLIGAGLSSGILGVLYALAQHDLKRLLAYHSIENIGIILLGLGVGVLGLSWGLPWLAVLGLSGGLLHVLNHALFKSLLFMGAGAVAHATGTREIDHLGGLIKKMPVTAATFLLASVAISGLPPLNGFVSELLIFLGAFEGRVIQIAQPNGVLLMVIAGLALIGGLAAACFAKAFGMVFLGQARSKHALHAHEVGLPMRLAMIFLALACTAIGLCAPWVLSLLSGVIKQFTDARPLGVEDTLALAAEPFWVLSLVSAMLMGLCLALVLIRLLLLRGKSVAQSVTWDCGYALPSARMQYTASSFAQPLTSLFRTLLPTRQTGTPVQGLFPTPSQFTTATPDAVRQHFFDPLFRGLGWGMSHLRWLQHGQVHLYMLYVALALLALVVWKLN